MTINFLLVHRGPEKFATSGPQKQKLVKFGPFFSRHRWREIFVPFFYFSVADMCMDVSEEG
jgi:hypothetical protein